MKAKNMPSPKNTRLQEKGWEYIGGLGIRGEGIDREEGIPKYVARPVINDLYRVGPKKYPPYPALIHWDVKKRQEVEVKTGHGDKILLSFGRVGLKWPRHFGHSLLYDKVADKPWTLFK